MKDIGKLESPFWFTCLTCLFSYMAIINSISVGCKTLIVQYNWTAREAGYLFGMPYLIAAIFSPLLGKIADKTGNRMTITIVGSFLMVLAHLLTLLIPDGCDRCALSIAPLFFLGLAYTTYAVVLWGSLPYMVEARLLGTAFGICTTFQNLATVIAPPLIAWLDPYSDPENFYYVGLFFLISSLAALGCNLLIYCSDQNMRNGILQSKEPMAKFEHYTDVRMQFQKDLREKYHLFKRPGSKRSVPLIRSPESSSQTRSLA